MGIHGIMTRRMQMSRKTFFTAVCLLCALAVSCLIHADASAAPNCVVQCFKDCCGDEGICNGDGEKACVVKCVKECDDSPGSPTPANMKCGGECLKDCCGDDGNCSGIGQKACVAKCVKGCRDSSDASTPSSGKVAGKD
jgi:hypothetical protein